MAVYKLLSILILLLVDNRSSSGGFQIIKNTSNPWRLHTYNQFRQKSMSSAAYCDVTNEEADFCADENIQSMPLSRSLIILTLQPSPANLVVELLALELFAPVVLSSIRIKLKNMQCY